MEMDRSGVGERMEAQAEGFCVAWEVLGRGGLYTQLFLVDIQVADDNKMGQVCYKIERWRRVEHSLTTHG